MISLRNQEQIWGQYLPPRRNINLPSGKILTIDISSIDPSICYLIEKDNCLMLTSDALYQILVSNGVKESDIPIMLTTVGMERMITKSNQIDSSDCIPILKNKIKFIEDVISDKVHIYKLTTHELKAQLIKLNYAKIRIGKNSEPSYDYLTRMSIHNFTSKNLEKLKTELAKYEKTIEPISNSEMQTMMDSNQQNYGYTWAMLKYLCIVS